MTNKLSEEQLDELIRPYFDMRFEGYVIDTRLMDGGREWFGFWKDDDNIIGYPLSDKEIWYCSGPHFYDGMLLFSLESKEYYEAMRRYVNKCYPKLEIKKIF
jgi:hypothetical protein